MPESPSFLARVRAARNQPVPDHIFTGLASLGCTESEIATLTRTTKEKLHDKGNLIAEGRARLKHSLRRAQIKFALRGNPSLLIWLGKTYLGQSDQQQSLAQHTNIVVDASLLSALQQSYQSTLSDIRRTKALDVPQPAATTPSSPRLHPALDRPDIIQHALTFPQDYITQHPSPAPDNLPAFPRDPSPCDATPDILEPGEEHEHDEHATSTQPLRRSETDSVEAEDFESSVLEPAPPMAPPPPQTPTPTPKRLTSLGFGKLGRLGKSGSKRAREEPEAGAEREGK